MLKYLCTLGLTALVLAAPLSAQAGPDEGAPAPQRETGRNRTKGALWGGGIGLVAGGILGGLSVQSDNDAPGASLVESAATGPAVVLGALFGAGIGALLGATVFAPSRPPASGAPDGMAVLVAPRRDATGGLTIGLLLRR